MFPKRSFFAVASIVFFGGLIACSFVDVKTPTKVQPQASPQVSPRVPPQVPPKLPVAPPVAPQSTSAPPPFAGTAFIVPGLINSTDPTSFKSLTPAGQGVRQMFDRRVNRFVNINAHLFSITFDDGMVTQAQVNTEFTPSEGQAVALKYAKLVGQLPAVLRSRVKELWIHKGNEDFGGGNNSLTIHTDRGDEYERGGFLEDILVHEAAHTSLDPAVASAPQWLLAETNDRQFISTYAEQNKTREDVAESFLPYLAIRYRPERVSPDTANKISKTMPNRINFFDSQHYPMHPVAH